jgi:chromate reductase|tara:strand:- start:184 stop:804 length:621 start_codon:yes stop_codon:yes gene_type:complete
MNLLSKKITLISGSLRKESYNTKVLKNIEKEITSQGYTTTFIDLNDYPLPFYSEDVELKGIPSNVFMLKNILKSSTGLIVSSPEYNGEISAVLKNTLDWLSRKKVNETPKENFLNLKTIVVGASIGKNGASRSIERLQVLLRELGVDKDTLNYSLAKASNDTFDQNGKLIISKEINIIRKLITGYLELIDSLREDLDSSITKVIQN